MEQTGSGLLLDIAWVCKIKGTSRYFDKGIYLGHWLWKWHLSKHIFCWMSPLGHLVSSSVLPFPALVIICLTTIPCFNPLTIGRMKPVSNQLLEMGRDRTNYTSTCTFFFFLWDENFLEVRFREDDFHSELKCTAWTWECFRVHHTTTPSPVL